jgi:hypothetical protein
VEGKEKEGREGGETQGAGAEPLVVAYFIINCDCYN